MLGVNIAQNAGLQSASSPMQIGTETTWSNNFVSAGTRMFATKTDGTLWAWGMMNEGMLAQNNTTYYSSPVQIPGTTWSTTSGQLAGGAGGWCAKTDGTMWVWGINKNGHLGVNNTTNYSSPIQIPGTGWKSVRSNSSTSNCIVKTDGTLWAVGGGNDGGLAQNNTTSYSSPVQIPGTTWKEVSGGYRYNIATKTDGTLWMWGSGTYGQLGQNYITIRSSTVQVPGTTWNLIQATQRTSLAIKTDGTLWGWGNNYNGEIGINQSGSGAYYSSPVQIPGTDWTGIRGGNYMVYATKKA